MNPREIAVICIVLGVLALSVATEILHALGFEWRMWPKEPKA